MNGAQNVFAYTTTLIAEQPFLAALVALSVILLIYCSFLSWRITQLTRGGDGKSLEGTIKKLAERTSALEAHAKKTELALENLDMRMQGSVRGVSVERFDPFQNAGGQQSFVTAFLNEKGDGVVVSGIHSRDIVRVYAKDVRGFTSERELSEEEQKAIKKAQKNLAP